MKYQISCTRCGSQHAIAPDTAHDWDEITCIDCGEFIDTCGHYADTHGVSYPMHALNLSHGLILQMARSSRALNDGPAALRSA